jgi:hypothetical protein
MISYSPSTLSTAGNGQQLVLEGVSSAAVKPAPPVARGVRNGAARVRRWTAARAHGARTPPPSTPATALVEPDAPPPIDAEPMADDAARDLPTAIEQLPFHSRVAWVMLTTTNMATSPCIPGPVAFDYAAAAMGARPHRAAERESTDEDMREPRQAPNATASATADSVADSAEALPPPLPSPSFVLRCPPLDNTEARAGVGTSTGESRAGKRNTVLSLKVGDVTVAALTTAREP